MWISNYCLLMLIIAAHSNALKLSLSNSEIEALQQILPQVEGILPHSYMKEDLYLIRFLRVANSNVDVAVKLIKSTIKWRSENKIDGILNEENPIDRELPYKVAIDKFASPAFLIVAGESDFRRVSFQGKRDQAIRSAWKIAETLATQLRAKNSLQGVAMVDLNGFSYRKHACSSCITFAQDVIESVEANYPVHASPIFFLNTPRTFEVMTNIIMVWLSPLSREVLHVFGFDKWEWTESLLKWFTHKQLYDMFGHNFSLYSNQNQIGHRSGKFGVHEKVRLTNRTELLASNAQTDYYAESLMVVALLVVSVQWFIK